MFRNAYRAELDLIALAATKANIMISLNGLIASAIMISVGFLHAEVTTPLYFIPMVIFVITSCISIYFALLAASPQAMRMDKGLTNWARKFFHRKKKFSQIKHRAKPYQGYIEGESNLLIYTDRAKLSKKDYWMHMRKLLIDQELIYEKMSDQLYWLGIITNTKFSRLNISYVVFRWGLVLSMLAFLSVKLFEFSSIATESYPETSLSQGIISKFEGIYEPSGAQQLSDGRILIVEDESSRALSIISLRSDLPPLEDASLDKNLVKSFHKKLVDLEGLTMDHEGFIYAITSHSRNHKGKRKASREKILRFKIEGDTITESSVYTKLIDNLSHLDIFKSALKLNTMGAGIGAINIEALGFSRNGNKLLMGLRSPLYDRKAIIISIENPSEIFEEGKPISLAQNPILLDLNGEGIRSLEYVPRLGAYLIVNELKGEDGKNHPSLWLWSGNRDHKPVQVKSDKIAGLKNVEAITPIVVQGEEMLLVTSDDGNANKAKPAHYMLLGYDTFPPSFSVSQ